MRSFRLFSAFPVSILLLSVCVLAGCIRSKPGESEANSPTAPGVNTKTGADGLLEIDPGETYQVKFETSKGDIYIEVYSGWAPLGAARFKELVTSGFFDQCRFFRVLPGFIVQWGINGDPEVQKDWETANLKDEPAKQKNVRGTITYAKAGPDSRTTQLFINYNDNTHSLNPQGFAPFAKVIRGMDIVDAINPEYGESPNQGLIQSRGNAYLKKEFPNLDYIIKATLLSSAEEIKPEETLKNVELKPESAQPPSPEKTEQPKPKEVEKKPAKKETDKKETPETKSNSKQSPQSKQPVTKQNKESLKPETIKEVK